MIAALVLTLALTPADALKNGRAQITSGDCLGAVATLQDAVPAAAALEPEPTRNDALAALHFYTALAFSNCRLPDKARQELRAFFRCHRGGSLDRRAYPPEFVALFDEVERAAAPNPASFEAHYPGFNELADVGPPRIDALWGASAEFQLLATDAERERWARVTGDEERMAFVADFWSRRDPALRDIVRRRAAFADRTFGDEMLRGSLSDRGKVFVLLGPPVRISMKPLTVQEGATPPRSRRLGFNGTVERWVYQQAQLPSGVPVSDVEFRFITEPGYGESVMQKDFWPLKTLAAARATKHGRTE